MDNQLANIAAAAAPVDLADLIKRTCKNCNVEKILEENFYKCVSSGAECYHWKCKRCWNPVPVKKIKGFKALPADQQLRLIEKIKDRRVSTKKISEDENILYSSLIYWIKNDMIKV